MSRYVKMHSWHVIRVVSGGYYITLCGRTTLDSAPTSDSYGDDKTCESCLRIAEKRGA